MKLKSGVVFCSVCALLSLSVLTGCSIDKDEISSSQNIITNVTSADDIISNYKNSERSSYHVNGEFVFNFDMQMNGKSVTSDSSEHFDVDIISGNMHGTVGMSSTETYSSSEDNDSTDIVSDFEFYLNNDGSDFYVKDISDDAVLSDWYYSNNANDIIANYLLFDLSEDMFNEVSDETTYELKDNTYVVSLPLDDMLMSDGVFGAIISDSIYSFNAYLVDDAEFQSALHDKSAVYTFDANTFDLLSVKTDNMSYSDDYVSDDDSGSGDTLNYQFDMQFVLDFSDYGQIDASSVIVPDDIRSSAVDMNSDDSDSSQDD